MHAHAVQTMKAPCNLVSHLSVSSRASISGWRHLSRLLTIFYIHEGITRGQPNDMHIQVQWQGRYTQITYLSYLCNTRNLLKVWKATLVAKTVSSLADSFLQKQQNCQFILVKATTAQWQVILSQESIYSWKHFTVQRWTYSSYNEVGKSWQAVNGLFQLIRVPPPMDDFSVSVPGAIDMLGYLRILL